MSNNPKENCRIIGIDIHPRCFAAAAMTLNKKQLWVHSRVELKDLDSWLKNHLAKGDKLIVETGSNSVSFAKKVTQMGFECILLNSVKVGQIKKAYCKTDKGDAVKLAQIYLSGLAKEMWMPDEKTILRRQVLSKYSQTNKAVVKAKNMIKSFLVENGINLDKGQTIYTDKGRDFFLSLKELSITQKLLLELIYKDLEHANNTKKELARIMANDLLTDDKAMGLIKLCGIRTICAYSLMAAVGDISRFASPKKLAAYLGLVPNVSQSGDNKKYGRIGLGGRKETRTFLVQAAQSVLRSTDDYGGNFKKWGVKMVMKKGRNVASVAIARKLATAAWYQLNGFKTNIHVPEKNLNAKIRKVTLEMGKELIRDIGYENPADFREEMKKKLLMVA